MSLRDYNAAVDFVDRNVAEGRGDKVAFVDSFRNLTYGQLRNAVARVGPMLAHLGVDPEDRVALILFDTVDFPVLFWGAVRAGIIPVLLNTRGSADQYRHLLQDSRAKVAFVSSPLIPVVEEVVQDLPALKRLVVVGDGPESGLRFEVLLAAENEGSAPARTCADEVAYWLYSSGTTGSPKGVMHVHSSPRVVAEAIGRRRIGYKEDDVVFSVPKLSSSYGLANAMFCPMAVGATSVLYPERSTPYGLFHVLGAFRPTMFFGMPTHYAAMLADPEGRGNAPSQNLRLCFSCGEPLPARVGREWKERFGLDIVNGIGSTEIGHFFLMNWPSAVEYGTAGFPIEGYDLKLIDDDGNEVEDGEMGELLVRCDSSAVGYWNQREQTRRIFLGEWTRTGDKCLRRPDGVYIYCGRSDDMFKVGGNWVSPLELEAALTSHPSVLEAAVIPAEESSGLVRSKAFVVLKDECEAAAGRALYEDLKLHVKRSLGSWKEPCWIEFVDALPKTASDKIHRYMLRDLAIRRDSRRIVCTG